MSETKVLSELVILEAKLKHAEEQLSLQKEVTERLVKAIESCGDQYSDGCGCCTTMMLKDDSDIKEALKKYEETK